MEQPTITAPPGFRGEFLSTAESRARHGSASGILTRTPTAVAIPADEADLVTLVAWAAETGTPLVPRGAGTGMPGGNVGDGIAVDLMSNFRAVGELNAELRRIEVQPGATLAEVNAACAHAGLMLPVDPSSDERCTIGGMIANNSAGAHSVKYGAMRDWVIGLRLVLPDGSRAEIERNEQSEQHPLDAIDAEIRARLEPRRREILDSWPKVKKNSSGYALYEFLERGDVLDLIVGSEGTLALVTSATLRLAPIPAERGVALLEFASLEAAGEAVESLLPLGPATCEMLDRTFLQIIRDAGADADYPLNDDLEAVLLVEMEADSVAEVGAALREVARAVANLAVRTSLAIDPDQQKRFWAVRHRASPLIAERAGNRTSMQFIEDSVVPVSALPQYVRLLRSILERYELPAVIFGHAGDGNLHVNPLVDATVPGFAETLERILNEVAEGVALLGGTLAGEHGDGRLRAPLLETIWGEEMVERFRMVKQTFDPAGIFNPGVILPLPGQRPFDAIRDFAVRAPA